MNYLIRHLRLFFFVIRLMLPWFLAITLASIILTTIITSISTLVFKDTFQYILVLVMGIVVLYGHVKNIIAKHKGENP